MESLAPVAEDAGRDAEDVVSDLSSLEDELLLMLAALERIESEMSRLLGRNWRSIASEPA